jgi:O-antigen/teichoic acid export membrane protein
MKATSIFGGVQIINIIILIIRSKVVAILLGPSGMGIMSLLNSTIGVFSSLTDFGLKTSAVKDIATANSTNDNHTIAITIRVVRRLVWLTGFLGFLLMMFSSSWLSRITFGNDDYTIAFICISVTLLLKQLSIGQLVVLQGLRKLKHLAKANVLGSLLGLIFTLPIYYLYGLDGIVPCIIITALFSLLLSWYFSNKIFVNKVKLSFKQTFHKGKNMLKLGVMISLSGLLTLAIAYLLRIYINQLSGIEQVGLYSAGFTMLNTYVGLIFSALGTDYFPRLSSVSNDNKLCKQLINQQSEITILIMAPILIIFIVFIKWIVILLYTNEFLPVIPMLYWAVIGIFFKASSWTISFLFLSKGAGKLFFWNELIVHIYTLALNIFGYYHFGLMGLGLSFLVAYCLYLIQVYIIVKIKYMFSYDISFIKIFLIQIFLASLTLFCVKYIENFYSIGIILIIISVWHSLVQLDKRINLKSLIQNLKNK